MNAPTTRDRQQVLLHPGDYHVTERNITLSTLLGSCVSVCLYDPIRRVMGMNHFLLANRRYSKEMPVLASEAGRYGIQAMELLINGLLSRGGSRSQLKAKAFGGGNVLGHRCRDESNFLCVGAVNTRFVRAFLERDNIPLVAADLGGNVGRQIHFNGVDFSVYVRKIVSEQSRHLADEERLYWRHSIEDHEKATPDIEFW